MLNIFKNKNIDKTKNIETENNNSVNYIYSNNPFAEEHRNKNVYIYRWKKYNGDYVKKGESVGELHFDDDLESIIDLYSGTDGIIEIKKDAYKYNLNSSN